MYIPNDQTGIPVLQALACTHALSQAGTDELWRRGLPRVLNAPDQDWPLPLAPSYDVVQEILANPITLKANTDLAAALAAVVTDTTQLDQILKINKSAEVASSASLNSMLSTSHRAKSPFSSLHASATTQEAKASNAVLSGDAHSCLNMLLDPATQDVMVKQLASISNMIPTKSEKALTQLLQNTFPGLDSTDIDAEALSRDDSAARPWVLRSLRNMVLRLVKEVDTSVYVLLGEKIVKEERMLDPYCVEVVQAAIETGIFPDDAIFTLSAYASARAEVVTNADSPLRKKPEVPQVEHRRQKCIESVAPQDDYLAALSVLGLGDAAARLAISAGDLTEQEFEDRLVDADAETIVDWAEKRLGQQPSPGRVAEVLDALPQHRQMDVLKEVSNRPNPLELQPELALCLPNASELKVSDRAAIYVANVANRTLGDSSDAWSLALQLLSQGWSQTTLELIRSVEALVDNQ